MLKELIKLANRLDDKGYRKEADTLDEIIREAMDETQTETHDELSVKILDEFTRASPRSHYGRLVAEVTHYLYPEQPIFVEKEFGLPDGGRYVVYEPSKESSSFKNALPLNILNEEVPEAYQKYVDVAKDLFEEKEEQINVEMDSISPGKYTPAGTELSHAERESEKIERFQSEF